MKMEKVTKMVRKSRLTQEPRFRWKTNSGSHCYAGHKGRSLEDSLTMIQGQKMIENPREDREQRGIWMETSEAQTRSQ